jgi:Calcineurin-like phosphoesterase
MQKSRCILIRSYKAETGLSCAREEDVARMVFRAVAHLRAALILTVALACAAAPARAATGEQIWLAASDIHLNPFDRSGVPALVGSDTNLELFRSMLAQMKHDVPNPSVVLLPGDFLVHAFPSVVRRRGGSHSYDAAGISTMQLIASAFDRAYPHAQFVVAMGNNDAPCGDYRSEAAGPYLDAVARIWAPLVNRNGAAPDFVASFERGGYYTATVRAAGVRMIALNTVVFSSRYEGLCGGGVDTQASDEMEWLDRTLHATPAGLRNVVMMHVPPGYDAFVTQMALGAIAWPFLKSEYNDRLVPAIAAPENHVALSIASHTHRFDFRMTGGVPMIVLGSVSPVYHNNPAFYALRVGAGGALRDIETYAFDEWSEEWIAPRSFDAKWTVASVDAASLARLHARLETDMALRRSWDLASNAWPSNPGIMWPMWSLNWRIPWCAQTTLAAGFERCAGIEARVLVARLLIPAAALVLVAVVAGVVLLIVRRRRMRTA